MSNVTKPRTVRPQTILLIVASAMFMEQLDGTVLATALPTMARSFNADPLHMNVALTSYLLTLAMFIPASGRIADRFGSRSVFRAAIALFTLGSVLCAQAPTLWALVAARMLQGAGGAMMSPVGRLVMLRVVSKAELVRSMAWLMVPATIGPIVGPPVGGFIVTYLSWHWIFYINVPIGLAGIALVTIFIDEMKEPTRTKFDLRGLVLSGTALACLMFGIEVGSRGAGSTGIVAALLGVGSVSGVLYWFHSRRIPRPMLDFRLLRVTTFRMSLLCGSLSRIAVGAMPFLLPMMFQVWLSACSAVQSGLITFVTFGRVAGDARLCADDPATSGVPPGADLDRCSGDRAAGVERGVPAGLAAAADLRGAGGERVFPVAAVHGLQHHRLCRCPAGGHECGHKFLHDVPADVADDGHRDFGGGVGGVDLDHAPCACRCCRGFLRRVLVRRRDLLPGTAAGATRLTDKGAGAELSGLRDRLGSGRRWCGGRDFRWKASDARVSHAARNVSGGTHRHVRPETAALRHLAGKPGARGPSTPRWCIVGAAGAAAGFGVTIAAAGVCRRFPAL